VRTFGGGRARTRDHPLPDSYQTPVVEAILQPLLHQLVGPAHQVQPVDAVELRRHPRPKQPARAPRGDRPCVDVLRVGPDQVAKGALMRDLAHPLDGADLVQGAQVGGQAAVDAQNLGVDDGLNDRNEKNIRGKK